MGLHAHAIPSRPDTSGPGYRAAEKTLPDGPNGQSAEAASNREVASRYGYGTFLLAARCGAALGAARGPPDATSEIQFLGGKRQRTIEYHLQCGPLGEDCVRTTREKHTDQAGCGSGRGSDAGAHAGVSADCAGDGTRRNTRRRCFANGPRISGFVPFAADRTLLAIQFLVIPFWIVALSWLNRSALAAILRKQAPTPSPTGGDRLQSS